MHIKKISFRNILSYREASFNFDQYNVVVGANNSGKTNLLRILNKISKAEDFDFLGLERNSKFDKNSPTEISFVFEFTDEEMKLIFQTIFNHEIKQTTFSKELRTMDVLIHWSDLIKDESYPNLILYRFYNGLTIFSYQNSNIVLDHNLVFKDQEAYQTFIDENKRLDWNQFLAQIIEAKSLQEDNSVGKKPTFFESCVKGESLEPYFYKDRIFYTTVSLGIEYKNNSPTVASSETIEFLSLNKNATYTIRPSFLINRILRKSYVTIEEIHPTYSQLIGNLVRLRDTYPDEYQELQEIFSELTNGIKIQVAKRTTQGAISTEEFILLKNMGKTFSIQESASGHYALIYILHSILNKQNQLIIIDEPEVHFHPIMITRLNEKLNDLAVNKNNQIIIITHSPKFVDYGLLDPAKESRLILVIRKNDFSEVNYASDSFKPSLKPHLFNPEIFFGKCSMIVEGSDDYFAIKAISDHFKSIFEKYNVTLMHCWGKDNVNAVIEIHNEFKIPFIAMVDCEFQGKMDNVVKLPKNLEDEYRKLGWAGTGKVKDDAYTFMEKLLPGGLDKLKKSQIWNAFERVIEKVGGTILS